MHELDFPRRLRTLSLFAGGGGLDMGLDEWLDTRAYCEIDRHAAGCLLTGMAQGRVSHAPIWGDVRTLDALELAAAGITPIEAIIGGFPCQDLSNAGHRAGLEGERSGLVFEYLRLIGELRPVVVFMENVAALAIRGLDRLLLELDALGYDARWAVVSAGAVGAPHDRERLWILAYPARERRGERRAERDRPWDAEALEPGGKLEAPPLCYTAGARLEGPGYPFAAWSAFPEPSGSGELEWPPGLPEPAICRSDDGMAYRSHRIRILGNGVVPQAARAAWIYLWTGKWVVA